MDFKVGDRIRHNNFGPGIIKEIDHSRWYWLYIEFNSTTRWMNDNNLTKLEEKENKMKIEEMFKVDGFTFNTREEAENHLLKLKLDDMFVSSTAVKTLIKNKEKILQLLLETMKGE